MILQVERDSLYGYLVAWERQHGPWENDWDFLAFTGNLYNAILVAISWNDQMISISEADECGACGKEMAYIFPAPYEIEEDQRMKKLNQPVSSDPGKKMPFAKVATQRKPKTMPKAPKKVGKPVGAGSAAF